jgi:hypothetical protein
LFIQILYIRFVNRFGRMPICRLLIEGAEKHSEISDLAEREARNSYNNCQDRHDGRAPAPNVEYILLQMEIGTAAKSRQY